MNLINDPWIPVRRADTSRDWIKPSDLTDWHEGKSPIIALASPRPDFDGALVQFLIGLLSSTCTPETPKQWRDWRKAPPSPAELDSKFSAYEDAFALSGREEKLFMQESLRVDRKGKPHPISYLLIGDPTKNTEDQNIDHFQKRRLQPTYLCERCAAAALFTMQIFAPSGGGGGEGKFTGIRGGGPLSTLMVGKNLWETVWVNVIVGGIYATKGLSWKTFPWLDMHQFIPKTASTKTIHSSDMNPKHVFWSMPRRIELELRSNGTEAHCFLCGEVRNLVCERYFDKDGGLTYQHKRGSTKRPSWIEPRHPLSPYTINKKDKSPSAVHARFGGIGYRHWLGFVESSETDQIDRRPAEAVYQFRKLCDREDGRLWAFGFDMENMKARCWYDALMPLLWIDKEKESYFYAHIANLVSAARYVSGVVLSAVIKATLLEAKQKEASHDGGKYSRVVWRWPKDLLTKLKKSPSEKTRAIEERVNASGAELENRVENALLSGPVSARNDFWYSTEDAFYRRLAELRDTLCANRAERPVLTDWRRDLISHAERVFLARVTPGDFDSGDPRRVALAHQEMKMFLKGNKLYELLGIPAIVKKDEKEANDVV